MPTAYKIPENYPEEIARFRKQASDFIAGKLDLVAWKGFRVGQGLYEQRTPNTYMLRARIGAGILSPLQLRRIGELAYSFGSPAIHFTTRQDIQFHYLHIEDVEGAQERLAEVGITTHGGGGNTVRNITLSPEAGIDPEEIFDPTPYVTALTTRMIAEPDSFDLPRKFKMSFSNNFKDTADARIACLGFIAKIVEGKRGFVVYAGGGMGGQPMPGILLETFLPVEDLYIYVKAIKVLFDHNGNRRNRLKAKLKFLVQKLGIEEFRKSIHQEIETLRSFGVPSLEIEENISPIIPARISPVIINANNADYLQWKRRYVRPQKQCGFYSILVPLFLGDLKIEDALGLADLLSAFGEDTLRITKEQNLLLRNIPESHLGNIFNGLNAIYTLSDHPCVIANLITCTGADTCKLGLCMPRGLVIPIIDALQESGINLDDLDDIKIHISGCPNSCGRHPTADLGFFGRVGRSEGVSFPAYTVVAGAGVTEERYRFAQVLGWISAKELPQFLVNILRLWLAQDHRRAGFTEWLAHGGFSQIAELTLRQQIVPSLETAPEYYVDWGADAPFSVLKGQKAECSASVFDLIEVDASTVRESIAEIECSQDLDTTLARLILGASRMLLITRGIEAGKDNECIVAFLKEFIEQGLVDKHFANVLQYALKGDRDSLRHHKDDVIALGTAVLTLKDSLDDSLRFQNTRE